VRNIIFLVLISTTLYSAPLCSQDIPYDKRVSSFREIPVVENDRVTLLLKDSQRIVGDFMVYELNTVTVRGEDGIHSTPANNILYCRIEYFRSQRSLQYGMWGGIIGLFVGIPLGSQIVKQRSPDESVTDAFIYIGSTLGGGIIGGLIGIGIGLATIPGDVVYKIEQ